MATTNLFSDPVFKDGAFTSNDADVRAYAVQKTMQAMDLGAETDASKDPIEAEQRFRNAVNFLCGYSTDKRYRYRFALEAKPNEPRGHMFFPTTGHYLALINTLDHPEMVGVNPEIAHEHMAGLSFHHAVAQALAAGKLFHIDLNDQEFGRYDQDLRFGSANLKHAFFLVHLLEKHRYSGMKHFDSHAYRTADRADVIAFARGSMRTYKILQAKVAQWRADPEIQRLLASIPTGDAASNDLIAAYSRDNADRLVATAFDRSALASRPLAYEALDQRTMEILMGV